MKLINPVIGLMFFLCPPVLAVAQELAQDLPPFSTAYDPARDPFADGHAALRLARTSNRRVLIELGGDWCSWCHRLDDFLKRNPDIRTRLHQTFVMLKVNVSDANDNAEFLNAFPKPLGYPHMYVADTDGKLLLSKDTAELQQQGKYSRQRFLEFFEKWALPAREAHAGNTP
jgi:thiol:disulfide interchange protein